MLLLLLLLLLRCVIGLLVPQIQNGCDIVIADGLSIAGHLYEGQRDLGAVGRQDRASLSTVVNKSKMISQTS